jgi:hypothetical protein
MKVPYNYNVRSFVTVYCPYGHGDGHYADQVIATERPTHSPLLGPDGKNLEYEPPIKMGFVK